MKLSDEELVKYTHEINNMSQYGMAYLVRFADPGHPYFVNNEVYDIFSKRFRELGGMTPEISKQLGWEKH